MCHIFRYLECVTSFVPLNVSRLSSPLNVSCLSFQLNVSQTDRQTDTRTKKYRETYANSHTDTHMYTHTYTHIHMCTHARTLTDQRPLPPHPLRPQRECETESQHTHRVIRKSSHTRTISRRQLVNESSEVEIDRRNAHSTKLDYRCL